MFIQSPVVSQTVPQLHSCRTMTKTLGKVHANITNWQVVASLLCSMAGTYAKSHDVTTYKKKYKMDDRCDQVKFAIETLTLSTYLGIKLIEICTNSTYSLAGKLTIINLFVNESINFSSFYNIHPFITFVPYSTITIK